MSSPRVSPGVSIAFEEPLYGNRTAPALRSRIVRVQSDSDFSPSPPPAAAASPPSSRADSGDVAGDQPAVVDKRNGYNVRSPRNRSPLERRDVGRSRERSMDAGTPFATELTADIPRDMVMDRDREGMRDREGDGRTARGRDSDEFNTAVRGRGFERERGFHRENERLGNSVPSRDKYRDRDSGPRPGDDFGRREPDYHRFRNDAQDKRSPPEPPTRNDFNNRVRDRDRDRDRSRDRDRDRTGGSRASGDETGRGRGDWRRYDDDDAVDHRKNGNYADDSDRRPMDRGRDRGGRGRGRGGGNDLPVAPPLHSLHKATVHSIRPFGMFVRIDGYRNHGLVHLSQVSDHEVTKRDDSEEAKIQALSSVAGEGEEVWIKVISVKQEEDGNTKIGCSMKYVSQGDGRDLDPNNIQLEQQQSRPPWQEPQKMKLEAVYNVQCTRCGGHGHLKKECYSSGEKTYALLAEEEDMDIAAQNPTKGKGQMPKEALRTSMQPSSVQGGGISSQLLATGSVGRGRAMVQPAWMKHGIGVGGPVATPTVADQKERPDLPDKVTTVEEALAVIAKLKEEKHRRKEERRKKKEKRHSSRDEKDRHKRRHREEEGHKERHSSRKKHRT